MTKAFITETYYKLLQWTVQTTIGVYTVHYSGPYGAL